MKLLLLLSFAFLLGADEFPCVQPISVEKAPPNTIQINNEVKKRAQNSYIEALIIE